MAALPKLLNGDLASGFTVAQVAQKHDLTDPMVWSLVLKGKNDHERFKELGQAIYRKEIALSIWYFLRALQG